MPKNSNQKKKILCLMEIFVERTDPEHPLTVPMLLEALAEYHITAERKSVYDDIDALREFGMEISTESGNGRGYFLARREIEQKEVETLIDAVNYAPFLSEQKTGLLIRKLQRLISRYQAKALQSPTEGMSSRKEQDETVCENILLLHQTIRQGKGIQFHYWEYQVHFGSGASIIQQRQRGGRYFHALPLALDWENGHCWLIAFDREKSHITHYRVSQIEHLQLSSLTKEEKIATSLHMMQSDGSFPSKPLGGRRVTVKLQVANDLIGSIVDRFGKDILLFPKDKKHFTINVKVPLKDDFFGWVAGFAGKIVILHPTEAVQQMTQVLQQNSQQYQVLSCEKSIER